MITYKQAKAERIPVVFFSDGYGGITRGELDWDWEGGEGWVSIRGDVSDEFASLAEFWREDGPCFRTLVEAATGLPR